MFDAGTGFMRWGQEAGASHAGLRDVLEGGICVALLLLGRCFRCRMLPPRHGSRLFGRSYSCIDAAVSMLAAFPGMPSPMPPFSQRQPIACLASSQHLTSRRQRAASTAMCPSPALRTTGATWRPCAAWAASSRAACEWVWVAGLRDLLPLRTTCALHSACAALHDVHTASFPPDLQVRVQWLLHESHLSSSSAARGSSAGDGSGGGGSSGGPAVACMLAPAGGCNRPRPDAAHSALPFFANSLLLFLRLRQRLVVQQGLRSRATVAWESSGPFSCICGCRLGLLPLWQRQVPALSLTAAASCR